MKTFEAMRQYFMLLNDRACSQKGSNIWVENFQARICFFFEKIFFND